MCVLVCAVECMSMEFEKYLFISKAIFTVQPKIIQNSGSEETLYVSMYCMYVNTCMSIYIYVCVYVHPTIVLGFRQNLYT